MSIVEAEQPPSPSFDEQASRVMGELQASLVELMENLGETATSIERAVDVERVLRLDKSLAWQIFRLSQSAEVAEAVNVPSRPSVRRLVEAARRRHVPKGVTERVSAAFEQFEGFVSEHGGDRAGLMSMVSGLTGDRNDQYEVKVRKGVFRGQAHIWGVQARMQISTTIYYVTPGPDMTHHVASITEDFDLCRLRQSDPLVVPKWISTRGDPLSSEHAPDQRSGDQLVVTHDVEMLEEFCTHPLPRMIPVAGAGGARETELVVPPGRTGAVSLCSFLRRENIAQGPQTSYHGGKFITIPMESVVYEMLVPVGLTDPTTARVVIYGRRTHPERVFDERAGDRLSQRETVTHMGAQYGTPRLLGAPRHEEAVGRVLERFGWQDTRFDVFRCRVEYPVLHTLLSMFVDPPRR